MNKKLLKRVLKRLDDVLSKNDKTSEALWDILTALRGPDDESHYLKEHYTVPIRAAVFPQCAKREEYTCGAQFKIRYQHDLLEVPPITKLERENAIDHFLRHICAAQEAIEELNE